MFGGAGTAMLVGSALAPIAGGIAGKLFSGDDTDEARRLRERALAQYSGLSIPDIEGQKVAYEGPQLVGTYDPAMEQYFSAGPSKFEQVSTDPRLQQAQMSALAQLQQLGRSGMTAEERAALEGTQRAAAQQAQARQSGILQQMAQRGMGGGGSELAAQLAASQAGAEQARQSGLGISAQAQNRALEAISGAGQLGGQIRGQQFGEEAQRAQAEDIAKRFDIGNRQSLEARNISASREAQLANLREKQRIADAQVALRNQAEEHNKGLIAQQYNQRLNLAAGKAGALGGASQAAAERASGTNQMWGGIGAGVGQAAATAGLLSRLKSPAQTQSMGLTPDQEAQLNKISSSFTMPK